MVYSTQGEQRMEFCVHNTTWKIVDFDGLKLMQRPLPKKRSFGKEHHEEAVEEGFSKAAQFAKAKRIQLAKQRNELFSDAYVVLDIETTGLSCQSDEIIEIGALCIVNDEPQEEFHALVKCARSVPKAVVELTGITDEELEREGRAPEEVLGELITFFGDQTIVSHNVAFDMNFIQVACRRNNMQFPRNKVMDTLALSKRKLKGIKDYKLKTLAEHFSVDTEGMHRALRDCYITYGIYSKLKEI
jgi:CRISPR-associated protein Cas2